MWNSQLKLELINWIFVIVFESSSNIYSFSYWNVMAPISDLNFSRLSNTENSSGQHDLQGKQNLSYPEASFLVNTKQMMRSQELLFQSTLNYMLTIFTIEWWIWKTSSFIDIWTSRNTDCCWKILTWTWWSTLITFFSDISSEILNF